MLVQQARSSTELQGRKQKPVYVKYPWLMMRILENKLK